MKFVSEYLKQAAPQGPYNDRFKEIYKQDSLIHTTIDSIISYNGLPFKNGKFIKGKLGSGIYNNLNIAEFHVDLMYDIKPYLDVILKLYKKLWNKDFELQEGETYEHIRLAFRFSAPGQMSSKNDQIFSWISIDLFLDTKYHGSISSSNCGSTNLKQKYWILDTYNKLVKN